MATKGRRGAATNKGRGRNTGSGSSAGSALADQILARAVANGYTSGARLWHLGRDKAGRPMYRITYTWYAPHDRARRFGTRVVKTLSYQGGKIYEPTLKDKGTPDSGSSAGDQRQTDAALDAAKDQWYTAISKSPHSPHHKAQLRATVRNWKGSADALNNQMAKIFKPTWGPLIVDVNEDPGGEPEFGFDFGGIGGGGGGGGGGFGGPEYVAPDRRVVEDMVKGALISLVGHIPEGQIKAIADIYMKDHRKNFDTVDREIDPAQSMLEAIRDTEEYRVTHAQRPEGEDERSWISNRRELAKRGGLNTGLLDDFAITQATVGGDEKDMADAAAVAQFEATGSVRGTTLEEKMRRTSRAMFQNVRV